MIRRIVFILLLQITFVTFGQISTISIELFWNVKRIDLSNYDHELKLYVNDSLFASSSNSGMIEVPDSMSYMSDVWVEFSTSKFVATADIRTHFNPLNSPFDSLKPTLSFYYTSTRSFYKRKMISELGYIGEDDPFPRFDVLTKTVHDTKPYRHRIHCYTYSFNKKAKKSVAHGYRNMSDAEGGIYLVKHPDSLNLNTILIKPKDDIWSTNRCFRIHGVIIVNGVYRDKPYGIIVWQDPDDGSLFSGSFKVEAKRIDDKLYEFKILNNETNEILINERIKVKWHSLKLGESHTIEVDFDKPNFTNY